MPQYRQMILFTAFVAGVLAVMYGFFPSVVNFLLGIEGGDDAAYIGRRAAVLFAGFSLVLWCQRDLPKSQHRNSMTLTALFTLVVMACLGAAEVLRGYSGPMIWVVVGFELALAAGFLRVYISDRA